jgi:hypothetical protein
MQALFTLRVLSDTKEILTILFHFSSPESFTAMRFLKAVFSLDLGIFYYYISLRFPTKHSLSIQEAIPWRISSNCAYRALRGM